MTFSISHYRATNAELLQEMSAGALLRDVVAWTLSTLSLTEADGRPGTDLAIRRVARRARAGCGERRCNNWSRRTGRGVGHNPPEWVVLEYRCALAGLTMVTVNRRSSQRHRVEGCAGGVKPERPAYNLALFTMLRCWTNARFDWRVVPQVNWI